MLPICLRLATHHEPCTDEEIQMKMGLWVCFTLNFMGWHNFLLWGWVLVLFSWGSFPPPLVVLPKCLLFSYVSLLHVLEDTLQQ